MNVRSLKRAGAAVGVTFLISAAPNAYAETAVLDLAGFTIAEESPGTRYGSLFTFSGPLILTEVGFVTTAGSQKFSYQINSDGPVSVPVGGFSSFTGRVAWYALPNPVQMQAGDTVSVSNYGYSDFANSAVLYTFGSSGLIDWTSNNALVTFDGLNTSKSRTSGNIRVSNPGSNVAPEPGSIALLLTGGGALAGIALRRRRNAA